MSKKQEVKSKIGVKRQTVEDRALDDTVFSSCYFISSLPSLIGAQVKQTRLLPKLPTRKSNRNMSVDMEFNDKIIQVPNAYICPITLNIMSHPLVSKTGKHYERSAIISWLMKSNTCPLTRQPLFLSHLISDRALEEEIKRFKERHEITVDDDEEETDLCRDDAKDVVCAIASYSHRKQKKSLRRYQSERIHRMIRAALS